MEIQQIVARLRNQTLLWRLLVMGIAWFLIAGAAWWFLVYTNPERVFQDMLRHNFMTQGYTRTVEAEAEGGASQKRITQIQMGVSPSARIVEESKQPDSAQTTEFISTRERTFARFLEYQNPQVENIWAILPQANTLESEVIERTYFPMGRLDQAERERLLHFINQNTVYSVNYDTVRQEKVNGRSAYTYDVTVQLQAYAGMLQEFGRAIGFESYVAGIDPSRFASSEPVALKVSVDKVSHALLRWQGMGVSATESYSAYGITGKPVDTPMDYITLKELESRLE